VITCFIVPYLFSDWPKLHSEFSKSVPMRSSSCRLYNNHEERTRGHVSCVTTVLWVIMSRSHTLCCLLSVKNQKCEFHFSFIQCIIKQLDLFFFDIQNNQSLCKSYQPPQPIAVADNPHIDLDYSGHHKNLIQ